MLIWLYNFVFRTNFVAIVLQEEIVHLINDSALSLKLLIRFMDLSASFWLHFDFLDSDSETKSLFFIYIIRGLGFLNTLFIQCLTLKHFIIAVLQCDLPPLRSHCGVWGSPGPRFESEMGDPEAGTLTTRPPHL